MIFKKLSTNLRVRYFYSFTIITIYSMTVVDEEEHPQELCDEDEAEDQLEDIVTCESVHVNCWLYYIIILNVDKLI